MIAVLIALVALGGLGLAYVTGSVAWAWVALVSSGVGGLMLTYLLVGDAFFAEDEPAEDDEPESDAPADVVRPDRAAPSA